MKDKLQQIREKAIEEIERADNGCYDFYTFHNDCGIGFRR